MNAHQLDADGVIINTIVVDSLDALPNLVDAAIGGCAGDSVVNGAIAFKSPGTAVPQAIPMLNAHLVLIDEGWMPLIRAFIASQPDIQREKATVYLDMSITMHRTHPLVLAIPAAIGKTESEVDALFIKAAALAP